MGTAGAGGLGLVGTLVVLAVGWFFGVDISPLVSGMQDDARPGVERQLSAEEQEMGQFVSVVLADTEEIWTDVLARQAGLQYQEPRLVMFSGAVQSACGGASSAMGPFYCPGDQRVYLDTDFFRVMQRQMGAGGDFAYAYVIAHEIGHHVQNQIGILPRVNRLRGQVGQTDANRLSVLTELQADCFAGIWARHAGDRFGSVERGDIDEAVNASRAVGDDILMEKAGRAPMPDSFTHGSAAERSEWLIRGMQSGEMADCNTFAEAGL